MLGELVENYNVDDDGAADGPYCKGDEEEDDDHLSVNGHTEIPDKSSGSTSRSASWRCQVQRALMMMMLF